MQAVILAGGQGIRLHPLEANIAKSMMPLFDKPILEHSIMLLAKHGINDIIIATSSTLTEIPEYFGDGSRWGVKIRYSIEHEPKSTAGAVKLVQRMITGTFMVFSGDVITDFDLSAAIAKHWGSSALVSILLHKSHEPSQYGLVQHDLTGRISQFIEKPKAMEIIGNTISTGVYIMEPAALSSIPYDQNSDFGCHVFPRMLNNHEAVYGFNLRGYWCDIGDNTAYRNIHADALAGHLKIELPARQIREGVWVDERAEVHPSAAINSPVYVSAGACVKRNVVLGKNTIIGEGAIVDEGCELSQCVIGSQSRIGCNSVVRNSMVIGGYKIQEDEYLTNKFMIWKPVYAQSEESISVSNKPRGKAEKLKDNPNATRIHAL